jgi:hypothetical protein
VVRSRVPGETGPSGGPALTDVVGVVEAADEREVVVRRRDDSTRRIAREDILVVKAGPPAPPRRTPRAPREDAG